MGNNKITISNHYENRHKIPWRRPIRATFFSRKKFLKKNVFFTESFIDSKKEITMNDRSRQNNFKATILHLITKRLIKIPMLMTRSQKNIIFQFWTERRKSIIKGGALKKIQSNSVLNWIEACKNNQSINWSIWTGVKGQPILCGL